MKTEKRYYKVTDSKLVQPFLHFRGTAMLMHWAFQNMLNMDHTELAFKLFIDLVLTVLCTMFLVSWVPPGLAIALGFLFAHTLNFLFNGQIFVVLKHFGDVVHDLSDYDLYIQSVQQRLAKEPSIHWAAIYGSMSRGVLKTTSDLDIRMIRRPGFFNGIRACWFTLRERTRAHLERFPVDYLVFDSPRLLKKLRPDEPPIVIHEVSE